MYGLVSGFNDGGNLLASFASGRVIGPRRGVGLLLFALPGAAVVGPRVARTVGINVIDLQAQGRGAFVLIVVVSVTVVLLSWRISIPTSMTLALVGAMIGWAWTGQHSTIHWSGAGRVLIGMPISIVAGGVLAFWLYRIGLHLLGGLPHGQVLSFARGQYVSAAFQSFAYGANDLGKTVGLIAVAGALGGMPLAFGGPLPVGAAFASFLLGTLIGGWSLAERVGFGVIRLRPVQAMSAQLGSSAVVAALAFAGAPVSTTQTIDGALVGVGISLRASAIRWGMVRLMVASWVITLPLALVGAAAIHLALRVAGVSG
jgi:PiT family inorganic phosphate transporter